MLGSLFQEPQRHAWSAGTSSVCVWAWGDDWRFTRVLGRLLAHLLHRKCHHCQPGNSGMPQQPRRQHRAMNDAACKPGSLCDFDCESVGLSVKSVCACRLVQWCHGAPGLLLLLPPASRSGAWPKQRAAWLEATRSASLRHSIRQRCNRSRTSRHLSHPHVYVTCSATDY